jgi:nitroreductase
MPTSAPTDWHNLETKFPEQSSPAEKLKFLLQYAVLAPSSHNTQPWLFRIQHNTVELYADRTRSLPVVDPQDRALIISCGAALFQLRLAIRYFGYTNRVNLFPHGIHSNLLAQVHFGVPYQANYEEEKLFKAIPKRHTHRAKFLDQPIPKWLLSEMEAAAIAEHSWLEWIQTQETREAVAQLIAEGDRRQMENPKFRQELAAWIHPNHSSHRDGMPGYAHGFGDGLSYAGAFVVQHFDLGKMQAQKDQQLALQAPALVVFGTKTDQPNDWLLVGEALARVLLCARANDVWAAFMNQPIEVAACRPRLSHLLHHIGYPQLLVRFGFGSDARPTPRRAIEDVLL